MNLVDDLEWSVGIDDAAGSWQRAGLAGEEGVDLPCGLATLADGPDDERLTAATVAGCEHFRVWRSVRSDGCLDVAAIIQWDV